jgi:hypothetical protein
VDRTTTVIKAGTSDVQSSFAPVSKHFGVGTDPCPPGHGHRKGVVEESIGYITQSWWRTARVGSPTEAQAALDRWCVQVADQRLRDNEHRPGNTVLCDRRHDKRTRSVALPQLTHRHRQSGQNPKVIDHRCSDKAIRRNRRQGADRGRSATRRLGRSLVDGPGAEEARTEVQASDQGKWWRGQDLNLRPSGYEPS